MEALSPGEFREAAAGVTVRYGAGETPFGKARVAWSDRGICRLDFLESDVAGTRGLFDDPLLEQANWRSDDAGAAALLERVFARDRAHAGRGLSLWIAGTNFQIQVWRALLSIPPGGLLSYRHVARLIGYPAAARAVGNANAANPVGYLIPCHRVLRATGAIGRYRWGAPRMAAMVAWEGVTGVVD
jgi:AraC family transcriptional regulator of adaptative response/methylated-DNA-[protein]-cysteine methyltransferase